MAVAFDAKSTADTRLASGTSVNHSNLTVGSGSNRALVVTLCFDGVSLPTSLTVTWDSGGSNQACSLIASYTASPGKSVYLYGLVNPISGNKTLAASWTNSNECYIAAVSFTGVDQTGGATSFPNGTSNNGASGTTSTVTVTSAAGDFTVAAHNSAGDAFSAVNNTELYRDGTGVNSSAANYATGAASVSLTGTIATSSSWASAGVSVKAAAASATVSQPLTKPLFWPYRRRLFGRREIHPAAPQVGPSPPPPRPKPNVIIWPLRAKLEPWLPKPPVKPALPWSKLGRAGRRPVVVHPLVPAVPNAPPPTPAARLASLLIWPLRAKLELWLPKAKAKPALPWAKLSRTKPVVVHPLLPAVPNRNNYSLPADAGSYALAGTAAITRHAWVLSAAGASYVVSGTAASPKQARRVVAAGGSYTMIGTAATLTKSSGGFKYRIYYDMGSA